LADTYLSKIPIVTLRIVPFAGIVATSVIEMTPAQARELAAELLILAPRGGDGPDPLTEGVQA
jgi:hypothetical protein